jgi:hypothetical protein
MDWIDMAQDMDQCENSEPSGSMKCWEMTFSI